MRVLAIKGDGEIAVEERGTKELAAHQVRVRVAACGICGTDLRLIRSGSERVGLVPGHEFSGTITELGANVDGWSLGDVVVVCPFATCGVCKWCRSDSSVIRCETAYDNWSGGSLDGAFAEEAVVNSTQLTRVPAGADPKLAAIAEPLACGLYGTELAGVGEADRAVVIGAGPFGVLAALALRHRGVERVLVVQRSEARRRFVEQLGFPTVGLDDVGSTAEVLGGQATVVFECSGAPSALQTAMAILPPQGLVMAGGTSSKPFLVDAHALVAEERTVRGYAAYTRKAFDEAVELAVSPEFPARSLITDSVNLDGAATAFGDLLGGGRREQIKIMVEPSGAVG